MREATLTKALTVSFTKETFAQIKAITDQRKISMGEWVRIAAEKSLADTEFPECPEGGNKDDFRVQKKGPEILSSGPFYQKEFYYLLMLKLTSLVSVYKLLEVLVIFIL